MKMAEETKKEEKKEATAEAQEAVKKEGKEGTKKEVKLSTEVKSILKKIGDLGTEDKKALGLEIVKNLTVLELSEWVKSMEDEFGVSAAAPVAAMAAVSGTGGAGEKEEEKTSFSVILATIGSKKIQVIKEVRAVTNLGLKEAKELVEGAPKPIKENVSKEEAEEIKKKVEASGATVEIK
jgi:large subunit ribosomal protein L7/L12